MHNRFRAIAAGAAWAAFLLVAAGAARASLIGDTIQYQRFFNGSPFGRVLSAEVGPGLEYVDFTDSSIPFDMDFDANSLTLAKTVLNVGFSGVVLHFTDLDFLDASGDPTDAEIVGVDVAVSNVLFGTPVVTFGPHELFVDVTGTNWNSELGSQMTVTLLTSLDAISEPAPIGLLAASLLGGAVLRRRR